MFVGCPSRGGVSRGGLFELSLHKIHVSMMSNLASRGGVFVFVISQSHVLDQIKQSLHVV